MENLPHTVTGPDPLDKPIRSKKWALILIAGAIVLLVTLDLISGLNWTSTKSQSSKGATETTGAASVQGFDRGAREMAADLDKKRAALQATIDQAKRINFSGLLKPLPECDQTMRDKLNGTYYVTAASDVTPVHLSCEANNQWAVIPEAASGIVPPTAQQEDALYRSRPTGANGSSERDAKKEAAKAAREAALNSSSVALDFASSKTLMKSSVASAASRQEDSSNEAEPHKADEKPQKYDWDRFTGPMFRVFEGTVLETVLTNRLNGEFTGPVNVMVTTNVYSHDHQHILMPQGTRILGEAVKVTAAQQKRLGVVFHRAIMPDGYSVDFDRFAGLDQQGAAGLTGRVNSHWLKLVSTSILVGAIGGLAQVGGCGGGYSASASIRTGVGEQTSQEATQILSRALNQLPTITVYEGTRVRIWVQKDAELPAYENHTVPSSL